MIFEPDTLEAVEDDLWNRLVRAASDRRAEMRWLTLATVAPNGAPEARTVVLRAASRSIRRLEFHTDARTRKAAAIAAEPRVALVALDRRALIQIRIDGSAAALAQDDEEQVWASLSAKARAAYAQAQAPGAEIAAPEETATIGAVEARARFRAVAVTVDRADWLRLGPSRHRRAVFDYAGDEARRFWAAP